MCLISRKPARKFTGFNLRFAIRFQFSDAKLKLKRETVCVMKLDPNTKVSSLLAAIPSSGLVFDRFRIAPDTTSDLTLQQACAGAGIEFDEFLRALKEIDWRDEAPSTG